MPLLLLLLFVGLPILEIYVIVQVGQAIGIWWTLLLLLADSVLGTALMRSQGRAAWRRLNEAIAAGRPPAREVLDGALVIVGGAFLLAPGFVTDAIGALLLLPPTRALFRRLFVGALLSRVAAPLRFGVRVAGRGRPPRRGHGDYVDGSATEIRQDPPRLP